jgi:hypothetical protein
MKKFIFPVLMMAAVLVSCKDKETTTPSHEMENGTTMMDNDSTMMDSDSTMMKNDKMMANNMYACPMHPEVQGKLNDKCSKCGMKLTEPVLEK